MICVLTDVMTMERGVIVTIGIRLIEKQSSNQLKEERVYYLFIVLLVLLFKITP